MTTVGTPCGEQVFILSCEFLIDMRWPVALLEKESNLGHCAPVLSVFPLNISLTSIHQVELTSRRSSRDLIVVSIESWGMKSEKHFYYVSLWTIELKFPMRAGYKWRESCIFSGWMRNFLLAARRPSCAHCCSCVHINLPQACECVLRARVTTGRSRSKLTSEQLDPCYSRMLLPLPCCC